MTEKSEVLNVLKQVKPELSERFHVSSVGLFGSMVRGEHSEMSDIDIVVEFDRPVGIEFVDLAEYLQEKFNRRVDLVSKKGIKMHYLKSIENEIEYA